MSGYVGEMRQFVGSRPIIVPGSTILVQNEKLEILLQFRADTLDWGLPGGAMEAGESFEETAQRELYEETGLRAKHLDLLDVLSGEQFYYQYPNGDEVYNVIALFRATETTGELSMNDGESLELRYFPLKQLPPLEKRAGIILSKVSSMIAVL